MKRQEMGSTIGVEYLKSNIEDDEWSYVKDAGSLEKLIEALGGKKPNHWKVDRRFVDVDGEDTYTILIETKQSFKKTDAEQLKEYVDEEYALHPNTRLIAILANTNDDQIRVWKSEIDEDHFLKDEVVLDTMEHYKRFFIIEKENNREAVMHNTYELNELLHRMGINERNRSQFVGTCLLNVKRLFKKLCPDGRINADSNEKLKAHWNDMDPASIRAEIKATLNNLLDGSENKTEKVEILSNSVLDDEKVQKLAVEQWVEVFSFIFMKIYHYIDSNTTEGQDILNLFFITFNKYVGKADKNQAFTPDHITDFMVKLTNIRSDDVILDECCGSGSFLVKAMMSEIASARHNCTESEAVTKIDNIKKKQIYGIEKEAVAYGLATTNMLIHGDGSSNIEKGSCFDKEQFIVDAKPTVILMNPPYNANPSEIPDKFKNNWTENEKNGKDDPTSGMVFVKYLSDIVKTNGWKGVRLAVLLPMAAAIGSSRKSRIREMKASLLEDNTLEAVMSLPNDIFYPGANVQVCCMLFTLNSPHYDEEGRPFKETFFGYYKDDGFVKKKNAGRVEQFDENGNSLWNKIESEWLDLFRKKKTVTGLSVVKAVTAIDEWLAEAYMETDYSNLTQHDFQSTINEYLGFLISAGEIDEI